MESDLTRHDEWESIALLRRLNYILQHRKSSYILFLIIKRAKDELIYFLFNQLFCRDNLLVALKKKEVEWETTLNVKINLPI